jgi:hypothetical protein
MPEVNPQATEEVVFHPGLVPLHHVHIETPLVVRLDLPTGSEYRPPLYRAGRPPKVCLAVYLN